MSLEQRSTSDSRCHYCGDEIETAEWHPAVIDKDRDPKLFTFCEQSCKEQWQSNHE